MMIKRVLTKGDFNTFLKFPQKVYQQKDIHAEHYIMPLHIVTKMLIGDYKKDSTHLLLGLNDHNQVCARLGVKIHKHKDTMEIHFGFFEALKEQNQIVKALFDYARNLAPHSRIIGPYNFRMEDPYMGLLVEGFEYSPYFLMSYNPPYYQDYFDHVIEMKKEMDVFAYNVHHQASLDAQMKEKALLCKEKGFEIRWMRKNKMKEDTRIIARIFNEALENNWGFEHLLENQVKEMYTLFKLFVNPDAVGFAMKDGQEVGCLIILPDFNHAIAHSQGRIGFKLIYEMLFRKYQQESCRGYALGLKKQYQGHGLGAFLMYNVWQRCTRELGFKRGEISWILSENKAMNKLTEQLESQVNKVYRIYSKGPLKDA